MGQNKPNVPEQQMNMLNDFYTKSQSAPSPIENEFGGTRQNLSNQFQNAITRQTGDYGNIMGQYQGFNPNATASRNPQVQQGYDTLGSAGAGFKNFADTGGYSAQDIQDLRARGMSPITAAYGNSMRELDRARALGGNAGSPNYIAAVSKAQRTMPQQLSDAMQGVNAGLAQNIASNKLAGLSGEAGVGSSIGQLAGQEAGRQDTRTTAAEQEQLAKMGGQASLYSATPGQVSTFGNQALGAYGLSGQMEQSRNQTGLQALADNVNAFTGAKPITPWWQTALGIAGDTVPFLGGLGGLFKGGGGTLDTTSFT